MNTKFAQIARSLNLSPRQEEIIIGSLLGDGHLAQTTRGYAFRVNHGIAQKEYVDWKYQELIQFVNSMPDTHNENSYYFRTVSHPFFEQLRNEFYVGPKKIIPEKLIEWLTPLALSVWIMDDGTRAGNQLRINSQSFTYDENQKLARILEAKFGIESTINRDKHLFRLRIREKSMALTKKLTVPYIIPNMLYKFSL